VVGHYTSRYIGMQSLFEGSDESPSYSGLGVIPGRVTKFVSDGAVKVRVPHMGWNGISPVKESSVLETITSGDTVRITSVSVSTDIKMSLKFLVVAIVCICTYGGRILCNDMGR
jgi:imidazoleglycerol phosphate synthase glutamine amidotransferase subunit HisH